MQKPENKGPVNIFSKIMELFQVIFRKFSKLFDRIVFNKKGSVLISFILAIMIVVPINYQDISLQLFHDTTTSVTIPNVSVEVLADTDNYVIDGIPSTVDVTIKGDATDLQVFRQQQNIKVNADLRKYTEGDVVIDLEVNQLPSSLEATISPSSVEATISKKITKQFTVEAELMMGPGQKQSDFSTPVLSETTVEIIASQSQIDSIRSVKAIIDTNGQNTDFETDAEVVAYDSKGNRVQVEINPTTVHATVSLAQKESD